MPVRIVHDGVVTRSVRDTAAFVREAERAYRDLELPPVGDVTGPGRHRLRVALVTDSIGGRTTDAETGRDRAADGAAAGGARPHTSSRPRRRCPTPSRTTSSSTGAPWPWPSAAAGRRTFHRSYDRSRNDLLTQGLARHAARRAWRLPLAIARLRRSHRATRQFFADHDVVLTPTLSLTTPELGWLDPRLATTS